MLCFRKLGLALTVDGIPRADFVPQAEKCHVQSGLVLFTFVF